MAIKSDAEIYKIIEQYLKESSVPLSSADLWERVDVQSNAKSADKVSDYLGLMWRRGLLQRWDAPATSVSRARYAYSWMSEADKVPEKVARALHSVASSYKKSNVTITEEDNRIVLDFDKFTLTIQAKI